MKVLAVAALALALVALGSSPSLVDGQRPPPPPPRPRPPQPRPPRPRPPRPKPPRPRPPRPKPPRPKPPRPKPPRPKPPRPRPRPPPPRPPPPSPTPENACLGRIPQCTKCVPATGGAFQCSTCDAYSTLDTTTGYFDQTRATFVDEPFCDGLCMYYKQYGAGIYTDEGDSTLACQACTGSGGCGSCAAGSFKAPDSYAQYVFKPPATTVTACQTCGVCQFGKCSSLGCTACEEGATKLLVAGTVQQTDPPTCITEYCDEVAPGLPQSPNLNSYYPYCKVVSGTSQCNPVTGCTACASGYFKVRSSIVPWAARCQRCEGCPLAQCGASGCTTCPIAGLKNRTEVAGLLTPSGGKVYACRNGTTLRAFRGIEQLPQTAVWPVSEFAACGLTETGGVGDFMIMWFRSEGLAAQDYTTVDLDIATWAGQDAGKGPEVGGLKARTNGTASITFQFQTSQRVVVKLQYTDWDTQQTVTKTVYHALPKAQDQVCITLANTVTEDAPDRDAAMQVTIINSAAKKVLLQLTDNPSLTPRKLFNSTVFPGGGVTIYGRNGLVLGSPSGGVAWDRLASEKLVVLPSQAEWSELS